MMKFVTRLLAGLFLAALLGTLTTMRVCGRTAPDRGKVCTPDQTVQFLHEASAFPGRISALQLAVLGVLTFYVATVIWLWRRGRKRRAQRED